MNVAERAALLEKIRGVAEQAGVAILEIYGRGFSVAEKNDRSPLTEADMAAHHSIVSALSTLTPAVPVLSEESVDLYQQQRRQWPLFWMVDPLDGTREFIKRNDEFSVNIALIENHRATLGVVHAPVAGYSCSGGVGLKAERIEKSGSRSQLQATRQASKCLRITMSRSHPDPRLRRLLDNMGDYQLQPMGSALKFCLVASGQADIYFRFGPTSEWDTAAGQAVVEAAGGQVTDFNMQPLEYNRRDSLLNPDFVAFGGSSTDWQSILQMEQQETDHG